MVERSGGFRGVVCNGMRLVAMSACAGSFCSAVFEGQDGANWFCRGINGKVAGLKGK